MLHKFMNTQTCIDIPYYVCVICISVYKPYRENVIAIESEASDSNVYIDQSGFAHKEHNLHCDVHVTAENKHTLLPFESLDSFWITRTQRSRCRDKGL